MGFVNTLSEIENVKNIIDVGGQEKVESICNFTNIFEDFVGPIISRAKFMILMVAERLLLTKL